MFQLFLFFISSLTFVFSFTACVKVQDKVAEGKSNPAHISARNEDPISPSGEQWKIVEGPVANQYQINLKLNTNTQFVQRYEKDNEMNTKQILPMKIVEDYFVDSEPLLGRQVVYEIGHFIDNNPVVDKKLELSVPVDLEIIDSFSLNADKVVEGYRRIFIVKDVVINTKNFLLKIKADQLVAPNLNIISFNSDDNSREGLSGQNGGLIDLKLRTGVGSIHIQMRGQNGGRGATGAEVPPDVIISCSPIIGGQACDPVALVPNPQKPENYPVALPGRSGGQGFPGGNAGSVLIEITQTHQLKFTHTIEPGLGGEGGPGGPGQMVIRDNITYYGKTGNVGAKGPEGMSGSYCFLDIQSSFCINN